MLLIPYLDRKNYRQYKFEKFNTIWSNPEDGWIPRIELAWIVPLFRAQLLEQRSGTKMFCMKINRARDKAILITELQYAPPRDLQLLAVSLSPAERNIHRDHSIAKVEYMVYPTAFNQRKALNDLERKFFYGGKPISKK